MREISGTNVLRILLAELMQLSLYSEMLRCLFNFESNDFNPKMITGNYCRTMKSFNNDFVMFFPT